MISRDQEILERLSESVTSGAPLAVGLRAAAKEESGSALSNSLVAIAEKIEKGDSVDAALAAQLGRNSNHISAAIQAGARTGRLAQVLTELLHHQQFQRRLRSSFWVSLIYPVTLIVLLALVMTYVDTTIIPMFQSMFIDFGIGLPLATEILMSFHDVDLSKALAGLWTIPVGAVALRLLIGKANWRLFMSKMPFFGQLMHWNGTSQFARLLPIFLRQDIPLAQALEHTSSGIRDANIALATRRLAEKVKAGAKFGALIDGNHRLPQTAAVIIGWGEENDQLPESLEMLAEFGETRVERRTKWLATVLPPLVFILIAMTISGVALAIFLPLFTLISAFT